MRPMDRNVYQMLEDSAYSYIVDLIPIDPRAKPNSSQTSYTEKNSNFRHAVASFRDTKVISIIAKFTLSLVRCLY